MDPRPTPMPENSAPDAAFVAMRPAQRIKFDRWLFDHDIDNVEAGRRLKRHPLTISRYRKRFDDPDRRVPEADFIREAEALTGGAVAFDDWFRPCGVVYVPGSAAADQPVSEAAE